MPLKWRKCSELPGCFRRCAIVVLLQWLQGNNPPKMQREMQSDLKQRLQVTKYTDIEIMVVVTWYVMTFSMFECHKDYLL